MATFASLPPAAQAIIQAIADFLHFPVANFPGGAGDPAPSGGLAPSGGQLPAAGAADQIQFSHAAAAPADFAPRGTVVDPNTPIHDQHDLQHIVIDELAALVGVDPDHGFGSFHAGHWDLI